MELLARLIEQRLCARELDGDRDAVGAHELDVFAHVGIGNDKRVLDQRLRLLREQPVEAAVERDTCYDGDQNRRNRSDDGEQGYDANVQPRGRAAAPPRLHDAPDLARDDRYQQKHRGRVREQQRDDDLVRRGDRRETGEHNEGHQRREQRQRDRDETKRPRNPPRRRGGGSVHQFGGGGLADAGHRLVSSQTGAYTARGNTPV